MKQTLLTPDWVLPVSSAPKKNHSIVFDKERIRFVGSTAEAEKNFPNARRKSLPGKVIIPGLVNPHTHLDFSLYKNLLVMQDGDTMFDWIDRVIDLQPVTTVKMQREGVVEGLKEMQENNTALVGDILHHAFSDTLLRRTNLQGVCFHELSGFQPNKAKQLYEEAKANIRKLAVKSKPFSHFLAPHSPYAVSEELLQLIANDKERVSFHLAESEDEVMFLKKGEPRMQRIFEKLGKWDKTWQPPGCSPVRYFAALGLLHEKSIAVHMVATTEDDYPILEATKPNICLCPRSNVWLNNGLPPAKDYLDLGLNVCLATDGLGSNHDLSILNEMRFFKQQFPNIPDAITLKMATLNGAKALGMESHFGTLEPSKSSNIAIISNHDSSDPYAFLKFQDSSSEK